MELFICVLQESMAQLFSPRAVISFFGGDDSHGLAEVLHEGSEDELGMEDEEDDDSERPFDPLLVDQGKYTSSIRT